MVDDSNVVYTGCEHASSASLEHPRRSPGLVLMDQQDRPSAVFIGKSRMPWPIASEDARKYEINGRHLRTVVVCTADRGGVHRVGGATVLALPRFAAALGSLFFYVVAPLIALALSAGRRRTAIVCQSPYEGFGVMLLRRLLPRRLRPPVQIELHGDWRTATRTYGSSRRRTLSGVADRAAEWSVRRADRLRAVSTPLACMARETGYTGPIDRYVAFSDYSAFFDPEPVPPPERPHVVFAGVLERHKAPDVLLEAWSEVIREVPDALLTLVGRGRLESSVRDDVRRRHLESSVRLLPPMPRRDLCSLMDSSSCLVLPSLSEGLPRVVLEAMARGRAIVASAVGGIGELVEDGRNGWLVPPGDARQLAAALTTTLRDPALARAMGDVSRRRALDRDPLRDYEAGIERVADWISG